MKCKALEIRWHETKPIFGADLHAVPPTQHAKPAHPYAKLGATGAEPLADEDDQAREVREHRERDHKDRDKAWRLATCGGDNNVRLWLVTPRPHLGAPALSLPAKPSQPGAPAASSSSQAKSASTAAPAKEQDPEPKVEYLATLSQHTGVVNCVRFAPFGEVLASAGDDGNILIWVPGESSKKMGETDEDRAYEKESWRVRSMIRSMSGQEIYDLAWSPSGERLLAGSVDHTATIYDVLSGAPLYKIAEHTNYVQGVCWDPRGELIATQSSDRSMHVYEVREPKKGAAGGVEVHAVGKNSRLEVQRRPATTAAAAGAGSLKRARKPSEADLGAGSGSGSTLSAPSSNAGTLRPGMPPRALSTRSDVSDRSTATTATTAAAAPTTEITTPMDPPTGIPHHPPPPPPRTHSHSRRSSTSGSQPSQSPRLTPVAALPAGSLPLRSPSPAPPLPAVMLPLEPKPSPSSSGAGAGAGADDSDARAPVQTQTIKLYGDANSTPFFRRLCWSTDGSLLLTPAGLWEDPYAAVAPSSSSTGVKKDKKDKDKAAAQATEPRPTVYIYSRANVARPPVAHLPGHRTTSIAIRFCPVLFELRGGRRASAAREAVGGGEADEDEGARRIELGAEVKDVELDGSADNNSKEDKGKGKGKGRARDEGDDKPHSVFDLPYRMVYAVATLDSVYLYDTQQAGPIAMFGNLHYAPFTDLTWSVDGQTLVISSQDGYCSVVAFEPGELGTPCADQRPWAVSAAAPALAPATSAPAHQHAAHGSPTKAEHKTDAAPTGGALPALFAKAASTSGAAPAGIVDLTQSDSASSSPVKRPASAMSAGAADGEGDGAAPEKKHKKRVAPTLVRPLGT